MRLFTSHQRLRHSGIAVACFFAATVVFASDVADAKVKTLAMNKTFPDLVFVEVVGQKTGSPACHINNSWTYVLRVTTDEDKRMFALLTAAKLSQGSVRLAGNGLCDAFGSIESLSQAWLI